MNPHTDEILEALRPRMRTARVAHVRRLLAAVLIVPILGVGAVAMAADGGGDPGTETAGTPDAGDPAPEVDLPDIGVAGGDVAEAPTTTANADDPADDPADEKEPDGAAGGADDGEEPDAEVERTRVLSLGPIGSAEVEPTAAGWALAETALARGWSVELVEVGDDSLHVVVRKGDSLKLVVITWTPDGDLDVVISDLVIPTTTTTTTTTTTIPPTTTTAEPPAPIVDRFTVEVPGHGSFVVEREGGTLWVGQVTPAAGHDHVIERGEGHKVIVRFTDGEWNWFAKAKINEAGDVDIHLWDEPVPAEPVYQWVEIPGIGAVQFKLWSDGLVYVKNWESGCCELWDYHEGAGAEVAKIDFEGDGILWIVEAWGNEAGGISWEISDLSPEPPAEDPPTTTTEPPGEEEPSGEEEPA